MSEYEINEVIELAEDLKVKYESSNDVNEFNQAVIRLCDAVQELHVIDDFSEI